MRQTKLAWAAGLLDGEGCVQLIRRNDRGSSSGLDLRVTVSMTARPAVFQFARLFAARVYRQPRAKGRVQWACVVTGQQAANCLRQLLPWLLVKREEARILLLAALEMRLRGPRRPPSRVVAQQTRWITRMKELKRREYV